MDKAFQASIHIIFANALFSMQIIKDSLDSMSEHDEWVPIEGRKKFVTIFTINHTLSPLTDRQ